MRYRIWFLVVAVVLLTCVYSYADIPKTLNFQGRLTDASGKFVTDGNYSLTFKIYADSTGGSAKWTEVQSVAVSKGLFNAILGSQAPIPDSIFNNTNTWLGIQVGADPEMTPRQRLSSLGYAYRGAKADTSTYSKDSDKLDGLHASDFSSVGTDYGRSGVATDLYEGSTTLTDKYVNVAGPDSVYSTTGTAFKSKVAGSNAVALYGLQGSAVNTSSGNTYGSYGYASNIANGAAYAGYFTTSDSGTGQHFGVVGQGYGASASAAYGVLGSASNSSSGDVYAGSFTTSQMGTGTHYGVQAQALAYSSSPSYGINALGSNSSSGAVYGGLFSTLSAGTGTHYGLRAEGYGTSGANTYGSYGYADNTSSGGAYGGYFATTTSGTGDHFGIRTSGLGASSSTSYGLYSTAQNTSSGNAYGGYFYTYSSGTGLHYGVSATCNGNSDSSTYVYYGYGSNSSTGDVYAGFFKTSTFGTGVHYGVKAESYGASASPVHGLNGLADNTSTGAVYAGLFTATSSGTGTHYGIYSQSSGSSSSGTYGVLGTAYNTSTGTTYGTYSSASNSSTGAAFGVYSYAQNTSTGIAIGGYFDVPAYGTGPKYGIYATAPHAIAYAGYFDGDVGVSYDFYAYGSKNAAVKVDNGEYRLLSCQESPELWFEDFGEGQLVNGRVHIELDPLFLQTVTINGQHPMKVFVQLNDENCKGTAVKRGTTGFDVIELQNGTSNASFSYRIVAKRKGYEDRRLAKMEGPTPEEIAGQSAKIKADMEKDRVKMEQENQAVAAQK